MLQDEGHLRARIEYFYREERKMETIRIRLLRDLRRMCRHQNFLEAHDCVALPIWCVYVCLDCGHEERGRWIEGSRTFTGKAKRVITTGELRQHRRKNKALKRANLKK